MVVLEKVRSNRNSWHLLRLTMLSLVDCKPNIRGRPQGSSEVSAIVLLPPSRICKAGIVVEEKARISNVTEIIKKLEAVKVWVPDLV